MSFIIIIILAVIQTSGITLTEETQTFLGNRNNNNGLFGCQLIRVKYNIFCKTRLNAKKALLITFTALHVNYPHGT